MGDHIRWAGKGRTKRRSTNTKSFRCTELNPFPNLSLQLSQDMGYVLYSALGSFYIPSCIMVFVYIRIYYAAKKRARRGINKKSRKLDPVSLFLSL